MSLAERLPSPPTVHEVLATALADNKRCTLHELERAAALQGHSAIEVEIVLKALVRDRALEQVLVFRVSDAEPELTGRDDDEQGARLQKRTLRLVEAVNAAPPLVLPEPALVDHCEAVREEVTSIIARVQETSKVHARLPGRTNGKTPFWAKLCEAVKALPCGQTHYALNPEWTPAVLAKRASVQLCNWRTAGQVLGRFRCRVTDRGLLITRLE